MGENEDRISNLPDSIIQDILALLPSTKEAIRSSVLSKRWHHQWTRVPVLIFRTTTFSKFSRFVDTNLPLYDCLKIKKLHIELWDYFKPSTPSDPDFDSEVGFAIRKDVEELILYFVGHYYMLPEFFFNNASLVKLNTSCCDFVFLHNRSLSWEHLKVLNITYCRLPEKAIENILRGCPLLESLELTFFSPCEEQVIASKSLKKLVLEEVWFHGLQISCPNLEELKLFHDFYVYCMPKPMNWSSLICATLDFYNDETRYLSYEIEIIRQLQHVKELKFGSLFIQSLTKSNLGKALSSLSLKNKSVILDSPNFETHCGGITCVLHSLHVLENLVIKLQVHESLKTDLLDLNVSGENYWNSNEKVFNCLALHLRTVEIKDLSESDAHCNIVLDFVEFLLKNAAVLEKLVVIFKDGGKDFVTKVSQKLFNCPKVSQHATVELLSIN